MLQQLTARVKSGVGPSKVFIRGNRGSGKSMILRRGLLHGLAMAIPGLRYGVIRRNMPDLRQNHLIYLGIEMRKLGGDFHETHGITYYKNGAIGFFRPCEDEADVEKIVGAELGILVADEAPQIAWDLLRMISPSIRVADDMTGKKPYWTLEVYSGNPVGESIDELDHYCVDKDVSLLDDPEYNPNDWGSFKLMRADNPSIDETEYRKQFAGLQKHFKAAWLDGDRIGDRMLFDVFPRITRGMLTHHLDRERETPLPPEREDKPYHYIQELPFVPYQGQKVPLLKVPWIQVYRAFDMGYSPDPAICLWFAVLGNRIIAFHEETWYRTIAKDLATKIVEITKELIGDTPVGDTYIDPRCGITQGGDIVTVMDVLEGNGVPCFPSINDRILYADAIHGLLGEEVEPGVPKLQIYEPGCPMLAKYLPKMQWDKDNPRKMADHKYDHWPIGLAYFAISSGVLSVSSKPESQQEPFWMAWMRETNQRRGRRRA